MKDTEIQYSLETLCALTSIPQRTIRFYIQKGLVPRPEGAKKGSYYTERHLEVLLAIKRWQQAGLSLARIEELLAEQADPETLGVPPRARKSAGSVQVWSHIHIADGVELQLEPHQAGLSPEQIRELCQHVVSAYRHVTKEPQSN